jgi:hypothetical protein
MTKQLLSIKNQKSSFREGFNLLQKIDYQAVYKKCLSGLRVPSSTTDKKDVYRAGSEAIKCLEVQLAEQIAWFANVDFDFAATGMVSLAQCPECIMPLMVYVPILFDPTLLFRDDSTIDSLCDAVTEFYQCVLRGKCQPVDRNVKAQFKDAAQESQKLKSHKSTLRDAFDMFRKFDYQALYKNCLSGLQVPSSTTTKNEAYREGGKVFKCLLMQYFQQFALVADLDIDDKALNRVIERYEL